MSPPGRAATRAPAQPPAACAHTHSRGPVAAATRPAAPARAARHHSPHSEATQGHTDTGRLRETEGSLLATHTPTHTALPVLPPALEPCLQEQTEHSAWTKAVPGSRSPPAPRCVSLPLPGFTLHPEAKPNLSHRPLLPPSQPWILSHPWTRTHEATPPVRQPRGSSLRAMKAH